MPAETLDDEQSSLGLDYRKVDVFSLGMIVLEVMLGRFGLTRLQAAGLRRRVACLQAQPTPARPPRAVSVFGLVEVNRRRLSEREPIGEAVGGLDCQTAERR